MRIYELKTDGLKSPLGIDGLSPEFSWKQTGGEQKSYRIEVYKEDEKGEKVWDSGEVFSDENTGISYEGEKLESVSVYFWRVTVNGEAAESAKFETAFLDPDNEFKAMWIGQPFAFSGSVDDYRIDINAGKPVKRSRLYIATLGSGKVYLNGELLDDCYFDGGISTYSKRIYYRVYPLDLKAGRNALCLRAGYGFYGAKKVYALLRTEYEDGSVEEIPTFAGRVWNVKKDPVFYNAVYDGEGYDARLEEDWLNPDYQMTYGNWVAAFAVDPPTGKFKSNPIPPMRIVNTFKPLKVERKGSVWTVDAGVNICGFLSLTAKGGRGDKLIVTHGERLLTGGELDNANLRAAENKDVYIFKGAGEEKFRPEWTYHGFRYARIEVEGEIEITDIKVCLLRTAVEQSSEFECSDEMLNTLHEIAVRTEGNNLNGVFTDCPQRDERLGWLNDTSSRLYQSVNNFMLNKFLPNFTDMITDTQDDRGIITDTVPYEVGCTVADPISSYTLTAYLAYLYYGDIAVIKRNYGGFEKWLEYLKKDADNNGGVISYGYYGDWCPPAIYANGTHSLLVSETFMSGIYFLWYLKQMQLFARLAGKEGDVEKYNGYYLKYKELFRNRYYDGEKRVYGNGSQTELSVCTTVFSEDKEECAYWMKLADEDVTSKNYHITCGNQGYRHLIYNLAEYGYAETVIKILKQKDYPSWGFMLSKGATTVWERWEDVIGCDMHSFNHPMFTAYDGFFINYLLGIRPDLSENAFKKIVIKPCFVRSIERCKGSLGTIRGKISVEWKKTPEGIEMSVAVPEGCYCEVLTDREIILNGVLHKPNKN